MASLLSITKTHSSVKLCPVESVDYRVPSHRILEAELAKLEGPHAESIKHEMRLAFASYLKQGYCYLASRRLRHCYSRDAAESMAELITTFGTKLSRKAKGVSERWTLDKLPGLIPSDDGKTAQDNGHPSLSLSLAAEHLQWVAIPGEWLRVRHIAWSQYCQANGHRQNLDIDGSTAWGRATFAALDALEIPTSSVSTDDSKANAERQTIHRLTQQPVAKMAMRKHGRLYSPATTMQRTLRSASLIDGEQAVEIDLHACFLTVLASFLDDGDERDRAIKALQSNWYEQFEGVYQQHMQTLEADGKARRTEDGWQISRTKQRKGKAPQTVWESWSLKREFARQCLFWRAPKGDKPLRDVMQREYPGMMNIVYTIRRDATRQYGASYAAGELCNLLTSHEGSMMIDDAYRCLSRGGITALSIHDGFLIPSSKADIARQIVEAACERYLGFSPLVRRK